MSTGSGKKEIGVSPQELQVERNVTRMVALPIDNYKNTGVGLTLMFSGRSIVVFLKVVKSNPFNLKLN